MTDEADEPPVPKLPRGRGLKFSGPELFRIAITLAMLVAVVALTKPCANAASTFVMGFDGSSAPKRGSAVTPSIGSSGSAAPSTNPEEYERLEPGMTDEQVRAAVARSKAKLGSAAQTGSAGSAGSPTEPSSTVGARPRPAAFSNGNAVPLTGSAAPVTTPPANSVGTTAPSPSAPRPAQQSVAPSGH